MRLKGAAWLAGFPVTNAEIEIASINGTLLDFIGPGMDTGFRVAKFADPRALALTPELALMLLDAVEATEVERRKFCVFYRGRELLKGVLGDEPFPVFWLDMLDGEATKEDLLLGISRNDVSNHVKDFLREFIDQKTPRLRRPFIEGDHDPKYGEIPSDIVKHREKMMAEENNRGYIVDGENEPEDANAGVEIEISDPKPML